jgi:hypothetical protein
VADVAQSARVARCPRRVGPEIAMEAGFGNATQPWDVAIGHPLTAQIQGLHPHLHPRVGMMKPPIL